MVDLITALSLAIALEGIAYALFPEGMKRMMTHALEQPAGMLRAVGLMAALGGVFVLWLVRG
jgi:uncharacterized protein YjeT (DUF2065 family)